MPPCDSRSPGHSEEKGTNHPLVSTCRNSIRGGWWLYVTKFKWFVVQQAPEHSINHCASPVGKTCLAAWEHQLVGDT